MASLTLAATGDILIHRPEPSSALAALEPAFATADVTFGNFEGVLTDRHDALPGRGSGTIAATANASGLRAFHVLSLANNHSLDAGYGDLGDTLAALRAMGAKTVGAGRTPAEAWEPAVIDVAGHTVTFVAAASVFRVGYEAKGPRGGIAALAAVDHYAPRFPAAYVPGVPPQIISVASKDDWRRLEIAIETARQRAEFIVVSMHWGDHTRPYVVTDFERDTAKRLSELGVDLVLGHHQHRLRGVEFYARCRSSSDSVTSYSTSRVLWPSCVRTVPIGCIYLNPSWRGASAATDISRDRLASCSTNSRDGVRSRSLSLYRARKRRSVIFQSISTRTVRRGQCGAARSVGTISSR